jgi:aldehyde dehydrogenase
MLYAHPGTEGALVTFKSRYGNYIGGEFVAPVKGQYFTNISPVNGLPIAEFPRSSTEDIDKALDAAHAAADAWGRTSAQERSLVLLKIADRIEANLEVLAITETWDNGKAVRETLNADIPLAADHFRYFAGCIRAQEGSAVELPAADGRLETCPGPGRRQLRGAQTRRANATGHQRTDGTDR